MIVAAAVTVVLDHCSNRLWVKWLAALVAVTFVLQHGADFTIA
jgi:hypothetical protein